MSVDYNSYRIYMLRKRLIIIKQKQLINVLMK